MSIGQGRLDQAQIIEESVRVKMPARRHLKVTVTRTGLSPVHRERPIIRSALDATDTVALAHSYNNRLGKLATGKKFVKS